MSTDTNKTKLSIITINYNNKKGLQKTIQSVVSQLFSDFEYLIIDGASTDGSVDYIIELNDLNQHINEYIKPSDKDNYTKHIQNYKLKRFIGISEPDSGIYNAMNKGLKIAQGEYCLFLNSGDYFYNENSLNQLFSNNLTEDIVYCDMISVLEGKEIYNLIYPDILTFKQFFDNTLGHQSTIIKRNLFFTFGFYNEQNKYASDWEFFMLALAKHNVSYRHIPIFLSYFDLTGISSQQINNEEMMKERTSILKNNFPLFYDDYLSLKYAKKIQEELLSRSLLKRIKDIFFYNKKKLLFRK